MTESHVDKAARCGKCSQWVERITPHPGSQGVSTWRHVIPADHVAVPAGKAEHETRLTQLAGGPIDVKCSCGWGGVAPSIRVAEADAVEHKASKREDSPNGH
jgi:hypothetical protein